MSKGTEAWKQRISLENWSNFVKLEPRESCLAMQARNQWFPENEQDTLGPLEFTYREMPSKLRTKRGKKSAIFSFCGPFYPSLSLSFD